MLVFKCTKREVFEDINGVVYHLWFAPPANMFHPRDGQHFRYATRDTSEFNRYKLGVFYHLTPIPVDLDSI